MTDESKIARVALVLGAADEIGEAIATRLAKDGVKVALCDKATGRIDALRQRIADGGGEAIAVPLAEPTALAVASVVAQVLARFRRIDILVNHTPEPLRQPLSDLAASDYETTIAGILGLQGHFLHEVMPGMRRNGYGRVINIGGLAYLGSAKGINVAAAQAGLIGLTRSAALEAARDSVTVNTIVPGELTTATMAEEEITALANGIPVKRLGTVADIAHTAAFFAAEKTKYVTGQTLFVCGGKSVYYSMSV